MLITIRTVQNPCRAYTCLLVFFVYKNNLTLKQNACVLFSMSFVRYFTLRQASKWMANSDTQADIEYYTVLVVGKAQVLPKRKTCNQQPKGRCFNSDAVQGESQNDKGIERILIHYFIQALLNFGRTIQFVVCSRRFILIQAVYLVKAKA